MCGELVLNTNLSTHISHCVFLISLWCLGVTSRNSDSILIIFSLIIIMLMDYYAITYVFSFISPVRISSHSITYRVFYRRQT
jgi:hypothetical protein